MKLSVEIDFNSAEILRQRGLGGDNRAQKYLASEVKRLSDPYVPMHSGTLKNTAVIAGNGSSLTYIQPYAHYQYTGKVMGPNYLTEDGEWRSGRAPKHYTGAALEYSGGGMRGPQWDKRMMADKSEELVRNLKTFIGG